MRTIFFFKMHDFDITAEKKELHQHEIVTKINHKLSLNCLQRLL